MKKFRPVLLSLIFVLALCACTGNPDGLNSEFSSPDIAVTPTPSDFVPPETLPAPFTAPAGTVVCGIDLSGMTREEAMASLSDTALSYVLTLDVSGQTLTITGESADLSLDESLFDSCWKTLENGGEYSDSLFAVTADHIESAISKALEYSAENPYVAYSRSQGKFVVVAGSYGMDYEVDSIVAQAVAAMSRLSADCSVSADGYKTAPSVSADDPRLSAAAEEANRYLSISLAYSFASKTGESITEQLDTATIASFVRISNSYDVSISRSAIESHTSTLGSRYSEKVRTENFVSTGGETLPYTVKYYGRQVDCAALTDDIYTCVTTGVSGLREAPYLSEAQAAMPYKGSYVEIDLTTQRLWVYKDGVCVVDTPIVSGCVADNSKTPTGVYTIYNKATDCWLAGPTWLDHVDYWMPFYGAYGLHDASWRSEFGGEIYIHEGSHGCPNLPVDIAGQVYHNVSIGTPVIIYGGLTEPVDLTQEISGPDTYCFSRFDAPFQLDYTLKYGEAEVTFTSDNPEVVTVDTNGTVTIHNAGSANITISAAAFTYHTASSLTVQVNISPSCLPGNHAYGNWTQTVAPGCENAGIISRTCSICGDVDTQEIPATGHSFGDDGLCMNGCGASMPAESETPADGPAGTGMAGAEEH